MTRKDETTLMRAARRMVAALQAMEAARPTIYRAALEDPQHEVLGVMNDAALDLFETRPAAVIRWTLAPIDR